MDKPQRDVATPHSQPIRQLPVAPLQDDAPALRVHLLGGFTVTLGDQSLDPAAWRLRKAQHLVKLLPLAPGHRLHRERVVDLLWPDLDLDAASGQLLWHETHVNATVVACVRQSRAQRVIALDELETYVMDGANGRFVGGQYVVRLIAEKLGDVPAC